MSSSKVPPCKTREREGGRVKEGEREREEGGDGESKRERERERGRERGRRGESERARKRKREGERESVSERVRERECVLLRQRMCAWKREGKAHTHTFIRCLWCPLDASPKVCVIVLVHKLNHSPILQQLNSPNKKAKGRVSHEAERSKRTITHTEHAHAPVCLS